MRYFRRYLSLLFALVMSLSVFSSVALAAGNLKLHVYARAHTAGVSFAQTDIMNNSYGTVSGSIPNFNLVIPEVIINEIILADTDNSVILRSGSTYDLLIENVYFAMDLKDGSKTYHYNFWDGENESLIFVKYIYSNGSGTEYQNLFNSNLVNSAEVTYNPLKGNHTIKLNITPSKDILKVSFQENYSVNEKSYVNSYGSLDVSAGAISQYPLKLSITENDKNTGLLSNIWGSITSGFSELGNKLTSGFSELGNKLTSGFTSVVNGVKDVFNTCKQIVSGITELPGKLWSLIENGLKSLFVPSEEAMTAYKDRWDELLSSRLGAVYQVVHVLTDSWDGVMAADQTNTISFPSVSISLPGGETFSFGGYTVQIVPTGFDFLVTSLKIIVGIVCTIAFVNGMRKRYDEVMGAKT